MSFSIGIVGLTNAGKSTLFKALTKKEVKIAPHLFTTIEPNIAKVSLPDERLFKIAKIVNPERITPINLEFIDIAGLVKGAHQGQGLGNRFLSYIQGVEAILLVIRAFEDPEIEHPEKTINPKRDLEIIEKEFLMKDLKTIKSNLVKLEKSVKRGNKEEKEIFNLLKRIEKELERKKDISEIELKNEELSLLKQFQFLTLKPKIILFNIKESEKEKIKTELEDIKDPFLILDLKLEEEISSLRVEDLRELEISSLLDRVILACYNLLDLITFYTIVGKKETKAWLIKKGTQAKKAAGKIHSDFEEKFIRAEVLAWQKLIEAGSWQKAKELGLVKTVGKDYIIEDGNIIEFKI